MTFTSWDEVPAEHNRRGVVHRRLFGDNVQVQKLEVESGGEPVQPHRHEGVEQFFLIQEGEWEMAVEQQVRRVLPGDIVNVRPGQMHSIRLLSDEPGWLYEVYQPIMSVEIAAQRRKTEGDMI